MLATKEYPVISSDRAPGDSTTRAVRIGVIFVREPRKRLDTKIYRLSARGFEKRNGGFSYRESLYAVRHLHSCLLFYTSHSSRTKLPKTHVYVDPLLLFSSLERTRRRVSIVTSAVSHSCSSPRMWQLSNFGRCNFWTQTYLHRNSVKTHTLSIRNQRATLRRIYVTAHAQ